MNDRIRRLMESSRREVSSGDMEDPDLAALMFGVGVLRALSRAPVAVSPPPGETDDLDTILSMTLEALVECGLAELSHAGYAVTAEGFALDAQITTVGKAVREKLELE